MALVIALVGGVGLSGVLSLSVLERRREIGVMRAIGASSWLIIITLLAVLASVFPARSAARISVRESLAYQ